jgi:hypothetical protein
MRLSVISLVPLAFLAAALTACGDSSDSGSAAGVGPGNARVTSRPPKLLFSDDFEPSCQGVALTAAKAYDKASTAGHKVVYFKTYKDGSLLDSSSSLPKDWSVALSTSEDKYAAVDLVVCANRVKETFVKNCSGYKVKDKTSPLVVKWHTATYKITVHEAATGKELAAKEIAAKDADCPMFYTIPEGETEVDDYAVPSEETIIAIAKPFVQP